MTETTAPTGESILLCSSSVGAGHNAAALAILEGIRRTCPEAPAVFEDALEHVPSAFRLLYRGGYTLAVTKAPRLYGLGYRMANRPGGPGRSVGERVRLWVERRATRRYVASVLRRRPVLVVATHYLVAPHLGRRIQRGEEGLRLWIVVTDQEAHRYWYAEGVERYFVANADVADAVARWGVPAGRITVSGIPVHPHWTDPVDADEVRRRWKLPGDRPIVLFSGGTYFTLGPAAETVRAIIAATDAHVIALTGSDKRLLAALSALPESPSRLTAVPMTRQGHELAHVASLMVTKAGGLTTAECIAKGLAMVLTKPLPGQEAANARLLAAEGAAVVAPTAEEVVGQVKRLLADRQALADMRASAARLFRPATETITRAIVEGRKG